MNGFPSGKQTSPSADAGLVAWRRQRLLIAGFDEEVATEVARAPAFDLHALLELVDRGCPPPLAARIVAPLESEKTGVADDRR